MRVYFSNLGCKLNQAEIDDLRRRFVAVGHRLAPSLEEADLHVVNSCTVTHLAARDSRKLARRGGRLGRGVRTVLTGCYATDSAAEAAALAGVDLVVTNEVKHELLDRVHAHFPELVPESSEGIPIPYVPLSIGNTRALVKIEDGCNMGCSFCIIPSTRGRQRSREVEDVVAEVGQLAEGGYHEVVITGVQISEYRDSRGRRLADLVAVLLAETDVSRLRLTSIAPWKFDDRLLDLWSDPRLCRHIHMSLQSGCSATLRRMRRPYTAPQYAALAKRLRDAIPGLALTTDVIVGFPGESDDEFAQSLEFVEGMAFARPHVFTYSERAGTHAATLGDTVPHAVKKERVHAMIAVGREGEEAFRQHHLGATLEVLWEERRDGVWSGLSDNYLRVQTPAVAGEPSRTGSLGRARIDGIEGQVLLGTADPTSASVSAASTKPASSATVETRPSPLVVLPSG